MKKPHAPKKRTKKDGLPKKVYHRGGGGRNRRKKFDFPYRQTWTQKESYSRRKRALPAGSKGNVSREPKGGAARNQV